VRDLWDFELRVFSQWGEDGILTYLCDQLEIAKPRILEFGAGDFTECNSRFLAESRNASVYAVDARPEILSALHNVELRWRNSVWMIRDYVTPVTAPSLFQDAENRMGQVDILSIDLDGNDYWVLKSLELNSVKIAVAEYNPVFGHKRPVTIPRSDSFKREEAHYSFLYYGASLPAMILLFENQGFTFVGTNRAGNNAFFLHSSLADRCGIPLPSKSCLERYTDWRVRESRNQVGELDYLSGDDRRVLIGSLPVVDLDTGRLISVNEATA
jgi:hypothetical protein